MAYKEFDFGDDAPSDADDFVAAEVQAYCDKEGVDSSDNDPLQVVVATGAQHSYDTRDAARQEAKEAFAAFAETGLLIPRVVSAPASLSATVTFADSLTARAVLAGTQVGWGDVVFATVGTVTTEAGDTTAGIALQAVEPGSAGNGIAPGDALTLLDALPAAVSVVATSASSGGADAETLDEYVDRVSEELSTLRVGVSNARDAAILARRIPGVRRALSVDGWNPTAGTLDNALTIGLAVVDDAGLEPPTAVKDALAAYLTRDDIRTLNVAVRVVGATYTAVAVVWAGRSLPGYDPAAVQAAGNQAVRDLIDPARFSGGDARPPRWDGDNKVRLADVYGALYRVDGVATVTALTLNGSAADFTLAGVAPLPAPFTGGDPSTVAGTVTAP